MSRHLLKLTEQTCQKATIVSWVSAVNMYAEPLSPFILFSAEPSNILNLCTLAASISPTSRLWSIRPSAGFSPAYTVWDPSSYCGQNLISTHSQLTQRPSKEQKDQSSRESIGKCMPSADQCLDFFKESHSEEPSPWVWHQRANCPHWSQASHHVSSSSTA